MQQRGNRHFVRKRRGKKEPGREKRTTRRNTTEKFRTSLSKRGFLLSRPSYERHKLRRHN